MRPIDPYFSQVSDGYTIHVKMKTQNTRKWQSKNGNTCSLVMASSITHWLTRSTTTKIKTMDLLCITPKSLFKIWRRSQRLHLSLIQKWSGRMFLLTTRRHCAIGLSIWLTFMSLPPKTRHSSSSPPYHKAEHPSLSLSLSLSLSPLPCLSPSSSLLQTNHIRPDTHWMRAKRQCLSDRKIWHHWFERHLWTSTGTTTGTTSLPSEIETIWLF